MDFGFGYGLLMAIKVTFLFILIYICIPAQIFRFDNKDTFLDKVFISLIISNLVTIIIVHFLAFLKLYELLSLIPCYLVAYLTYTRIMNKSLGTVADVLGMKIVVNLLDLSEGRLGLRGELSKNLKNWFHKAKANVISVIRNAFINPFEGIFVIAALATAAFIRFNHSIIHAYYGASDSYVHLAWVKYLGANEIYRDGIYAYGYHAILSALSKLTFLDPYFILRFVGPLAGFMIVLSVYYFARKNFKSPYVALVAVLIYGIITDDRFPSYVWRQISALSQEYAVIFLLPGLHFFNLYMKNGFNKYLLLSSCCIVLTILIHPYVTVFIAISYAVLYLCHPSKYLNYKFLGKTALAVAMSFLAGVMPVIIGLMSGKKFHSTLGYIQENLQVTSTYTVSTPGLLKFSEDNPFLVILLICSSVSFIYGVFLSFNNVNKKEESRIYLFFGLISLLFYVMYRAANFGLPVIINPYRFGIFMALTATVTYAGILNIADFFIKSNRILKYFKQAATIAVLTVILIFTTLQIPEGDRFEYDESVNSYLKIKNSFPALDWTVVAPVEQYQECLGFGWHYELQLFAKKIPTGGQKGDKNFSIPTDYIFIFTEKTPLGSQSALDEDDLKREIPVPIGDETALYYRNAENRTAIEAKVFYWAEDYMKKKDNMKVFYDGDYIRIYMIEQDNKNPVKLFS